MSRFDSSAVGIRWPGVSSIDGSFCTPSLGMKKQRLVHVRVDQEVVRKAKHRAADLDISFAEFVRRAVAAAVEATKTPDLRNHRKAT